ncbi:hypothetical protein ANO11243_003360 [Dothideomycetidae sp. 11243]|nr:hypothetical protein ANO11243_003360 [fungal sp. No.11243]
MAPSIPGISAPPGTDMANLPNRRSAVVSSLVSLSIISLLMVLARMAVALRFKRRWQLSDYLIILAAGFFRRSLRSVYSATVTRPSESKTTIPRHQFELKERGLSDATVVQDDYSSERYILPGHDVRDSGGIIKTVGYDVQQTDTRKGLAF